METAKLSSKGQLVLPKAIRKALRAEEGTVFTVLAVGDTVLLKKVDLPTEREFFEATEKLRRMAKEKGIRTPHDVVRLVHEHRKRS